MMSFTFIVAFLFALYVVIWLFHLFLKSCMKYPYYEFLKGTGLKFGILSLTWTTNAINEYIYKWSKHLSRVLKKWFTCGYIVTIWVFLPYSIWALYAILCEMFCETYDFENYKAPILKLMIPGLNEPMSDLWVYVFPIAFSAIFHELGHAMAAVQHDVELISVGIYVFAIIPIAFVELNTEQLNDLPVTKRLRIYCAGIWHNVFTAFLAMVLFSSIPTLTTIAFESGVGVRVTSMSKDSPLQDACGLHVGDVIISINNCQIRNSYDWDYCIDRAHNRFGICKSGEYLDNNNEFILYVFDAPKDYEVIECCYKDQLNSLCFEYMESKKAVDPVLPGQFSCLKPEDMVTTTYTKCTKSNDYFCPKGEYCLKPSLNNNTYFMIIERKNDCSIIYFGLPYDLSKMVIIDQYFPRMGLFSFFSPTPFQKMLKYLFIFSMGIAFVNVLPCYGLDGHYIFRNLIQILANYLNKDGGFVTLFTMIAVAIGTGLIAPTILYLFYKSYILSGF